MCGIFAVVNDQTNQAAQTVLAGLKKLEYRGYDSWGIAIKPVSLNTLKLEKHMGKIGEAKTSLPAGTMAIGHTRWATHGGVTDANAHPHLDCQQKIAVIHNGIAENYQELKKDLINNHHRFLSETDTEVIAHLIEEKLKKNNIIKSVFETFDDLVGSNAIGILDSHTSTIIACRNGSPLVVGFNEKQKQYFLGSDVPAFLRYTNQVYFLSDGEGVVINSRGVKIYDLKTKKEKKFKPQILDWKLEDAEKSGYPHFLLKEINEQVTTIPKTAAINDLAIQKIAQMINAGYKVVLTGCGTASYCALTGKYFFSQVGVETQTYQANEFVPFLPFVDRKTLFIAISQSGETADTLIAARQAKKNSAYLVALINARGSTLERMTDLTIPVGAGPEIAVVSTKAFTAQLSTLYLLSRAVEKKLQQGKNEIKKMGSILKQWLNPILINQLINTAKLLIDEEHIYLIGKHISYPATLEFALKIKETSYLHAEPFAAGELKHGVITLIQKNTPCFVLATNSADERDVLASAAELKARGGKIIAVAPFQSNEFDLLIKTPDLGRLTIFPNIIVGQLLGYYLGLGRGADPDKPRNLAKSVTVK